MSRCFGRQRAINKWALCVHTVRYENVNNIALRIRVYVYLCICISPLFECVCANLSSGKVVKQHFNFLTVLLGKKKLVRVLLLIKKRKGKNKRAAMRMCVWECECVFLYLYKCQHVHVHVSFCLGSLHVGWVQKWVSSWSRSPCSSPSSSYGCVALFSVYFCCFLYLPPPPALLLLWWMTLHLVEFFVWLEQFTRHKH